MRYTLNDLYAAMPWDQIDTVVFDVGNVLLTFVPQQILQRYVPEVPELHDELMLRIFRSPYWCMLDRGSASPEDIREAMIGKREDLRPYITAVMTHWVEMKDVIEEGVNALKCCKAHGKRVIVLSNYGDAPFGVVEHKYDFFDLFDAKVVSSRVSMIKPMPDIYHYVTETYRLDPARTLFIDDAPINIEAALNEGWQGLCFNRPGVLDTFFAQ